MLNPLALQRPSDGIRARERDGLHRVMGDQHVAHFGAFADDQIEHAIW